MSCRRQFLVLDLVAGVTGLLVGVRQFPDVGTVPDQLVRPSRRALPRPDRLDPAHAGHLHKDSQDVQPAGAFPEDERRQQGHHVGLTVSLQVGVTPGRVARDISLTDIIVTAGGLSTLWAVAAAPRLT